MIGALRGKALSLLNLHLAGVALLLILNLFLAVRLFVAWHAASADREEQITQAQVTLAQLQAENRRLSGLSGKAEQARTGAAEFYTERIPANYSSILTTLGALTAHSGAKLTRASYPKTPAIPGLSEIRIDGNMTGEYAAILRFINGIERDHTFFVIDGITLTGQQGGLVNLRLRMTTYLREVDAAVAPALSEVKSRPIVEAVH